MMFNLQKLLLTSLFMILMISSLKLEYRNKVFEREKSRIESNMNVMRLGNYIRRMIMKVKII